MRSELVFAATAHVTNRYLLTSIASKATRMLHRPNSRLEDTSNDVFRLFGHDDLTFISPASRLRGPVSLLSKTHEHHLSGLR